MTIHAVSPLFVGRADELAVLEEGLARARAGSVSTVLVGGEAGVGKTRLIREFAGRAGDCRVLIGGCLELGADGLPFAPFTAVLRELVRDLGAEGIAALLPGGTTGELARLLPEFGEPPDRTTRARRGPGCSSRCWSCWSGWPRPSPVVLVIEDAHWADRSTRDLLAFLIRNQRPGRRC